MRIKLLAAVVGSAASLLLAACGGGDSAPTMGGTAAVGAPIVGGSISVKCSGGAPLSTTTGSDGGWQVTISGQTLPCAVEVSGGSVGGVASAGVYHSIAVSVGTVNVTPLTDLVVANLAGSAPSAWFSGIGAASWTAVNQTAVTTALNRVSTALGVSTVLNGSNPMTTKFTPTHGNTLDDVLSALAASGVDYGSLLALASNVTITLPNGYNFATAYAGVTGSQGGGNNNGGGSGNCTSGQTALAFATSVSGGLYSNGQQVCISASATTLTLGSKTLSNPTQNTAVTAPYTSYNFVDGATTYEVIFNAGALFEINVSSGGAFGGQFSTDSTGTGGGGGTGGGTSTLTVQVTASGIVTPAITVNNVPVPGSESEFCGAITSGADATFSGIGAAAGGTLTINSCSFASKVGNISATLHMTTPVVLTLPYSIRYTYQ